MESIETYVGLDVHRKLVVATALDERGKQLEQAKLTSAPQELTDFLGRLPGHKHVAIEAGAMWEPYFDTAEATGAEVTLSHPLKTKLIAGASLKSDKVDSEALARLLRLDALPTSFAPPPELRRLHALVRDRLFYQRTWQSVANHVYHRLIRLGLAYEDGIFHEIRKQAELPKLNESDIDRGLDTLQEIEGRVKDLDRAMHAAWSEIPEAQLLTSIPGIGERTAVLFVAFLCPIERFRTAEQVASYVGLVPRSHQSAERAYHGRIKRDSNGLLRWALVEAGWSHRRFEPKGDVARFGNRIGRRRGRGKGMTAAARKLVRIIFAILKEKRPYSLHAPGLPAPSKVLRRRTTAA